MGNHQEEFVSTLFLIQNGIMSSYEFKELADKRGLLDANIADGTVGLRQLAMGLKEELRVIQKSKRVVPSDKANNDWARTTYVYLCTRIVTMFQYMYRHFSIGEDVLAEILFFVESNATYLKVENLEFLTEAISQTSSYEELRNKLVNIYGHMQCFESMMDIFRDAVESKNENILPLWDLVIHNTKISCPTMITTAFETGSNLTSGYVAEVIRFQHFEWFSENQTDIFLIRKFFDDLKELDTASLRLYELMIDIESGRKNSRIIAIRQLFTEACKKFGQNNIGIWNKCIRFEFSKKNPTLAKRLVNDSLKCLNQDLRGAMMDLIKQISSDFKQIIKIPK